MWPFDRFRSRSEEPALPDTWSLAQGEYEGKPMLVRRRDRMAKLIGHLAYPTRVGVAVPLRAPRPNGFPQADETTELEAIEDALVRALEAEREALLVLVISTNGMREFVFYARDPDRASVLLRAVEGSITSHELQFAIKPDPDWSVYKQFT